jgi:integrase
VHTLGWGARQFYKGHPFINWIDSYKADFRYNVDSCLEEDVNAEKPELGKFEDVPLDKMTLVGLEVLRDRKLAAKRYGAALNRVRHLKRLFKWLKRKGHIKGENPALDLEIVKTPKEHQRRHTWTDGEISSYRKTHPIGSKARLAFELHYHYLARVDVVRVGPANVKVRHGIRFLEGNRKKTGEAFKVAMSPVLLECIEKTPPMRGKLRVVGATTFLVSGKGPLQYDEKHYGKKVFRAWCDAAGLPKRCTTHGIRRAKASHRAHDQLTSEELNAEAGWKPGSTESATYLKDVNKDILSLNAAKKGGTK